MATSSGPVVRVDLQVGDLAQTRFALSPLFETLAGLRALRNPGRHGLHLSWVRWAQARLAERSLPLPTLWPPLVEPPWLPEFLLPAPSTRLPSIAEETGRLQATTARQVRVSIARYPAASRASAAIGELAARPGAVLRAVAAEFRAAHDLLIAPHWPRMQALLEADITYRARNLAEGGAARMFADLHEGLTWHGDYLEVSDPARPAGASRVAVVGPGGLVLVPSVFLWPELWVKRRTITYTAIRYPARGVAALWELAPGQDQALPRQACEALLGRPRARLLALLASPATTGELAGRLRVTPSAVSQHLTVLRAAALIRTERSGRTALHLITPLGRALLGSGPCTAARRA
jgi:DNA-binding MarR family transcriptional regulator